MKIAVVSDIHGNVLALEAVLADIKEEAPDGVVNLGDCLAGPLWPEETAAILRETAWPTVRGNHDRIILDDPINKMGPTDRFAAERLTAQSLEWLRTTSPTIRLSDEVLLVHGTPEDDDRYLTEKNEGPKGHQPDEESLLAELNGEQAQVVCSGHSHIPRVLSLQSTGQTLLNPGTVGFPSFDSQHPRYLAGEVGDRRAQYALMTRNAKGWTFEQKYLAYDIDAAAREAEKNGRSGWAQAFQEGYFGPLSQQ
ncbi:metallophosphoesterase family protein [uncultured Roseibium sp.]|uniref:metallophosphoesterase family protein n=1 Tax=uncultured Roseibium sp. TaxID=1936171 RepID=UPI00260EBDD7|nr:metallophosphoesterase family protein [uncultured Roseibium sp.]